jgi:hypothetical protein
MSKKDKPLDLEALLGVWPALATVPPVGFADRVLAAATATPAVPLKLVTTPPPSTRRAFFAGAALAAAFVLVPLFVYRTARPSQQPAITAAASPDLGFERD